jgi:hypothetical protein
VGFISYEQGLENGHESTANFLPPGSSVNTSRDIPKVTGNTVLDRFNLPFKSMYILDHRNKALNTIKYILSSISIATSIAA